MAFRSRLSSAHGACRHARAAPEPLCIGEHANREGDDNAVGHAHLVPAMCRAAVAAGADGLLLEVHPDPEHALSDGAQSIDPRALTDLMTALKRIAPAVGRSL